MPAASTKSQLFEAFEPVLNGRRVILLDVPLVEQQLLGLVWRGGKIDHPGGEHDDWANAVAGVVALLAQRPTDVDAVPTLVHAHAGPEFESAAGGAGSFGFGVDGGWPDRWSDHRPMRIPHEGDFR